MAVSSSTSGFVEHIQIPCEPFPVPAAWPRANAKLPAITSCFSPKAASYPEALKPWSCRKITKIVLYVVIFPIGILWVINKLACHALWAIGNQIIKCYGGKGLIESALLPALDSEGPVAEEDRKKDKEEFFSNPSKNSSPLILTTPDGVKLDGAVLWANGMNSNSSSEALESSKWIVLYNGNGMLYENWMNSVRNQYPKEVSDTHNFILFNYRGVGDSQGFPNTARDLVLDGITPIDSLKKMGVKDSNIYLEGISLGGGISAQAASHHPKVNAANLKSFSSMANLLNGVVHNSLVEKHKWSSCAAKSLAWVISGLAGHILSTMGWEIDSAKAWPKIQGKKRIETANQDQLMIGDGRLANYLKLQNDPTHLPYDGDHNGLPPPEAIQKRAIHFGLA